jgi:glutamyl-tRNA synthetase
LEQAGLVTDPTDPGLLALLERLVPMLRNRIKLLTEAPELMRGFFVTPSPVRADLIDDSTTAEMADGRLSATAAALTAMEPFDLPTIKAKVMELAAADASGDKAAFFKTLYVAITGGPKALPVMDTIEILGRTEVLARIERARAALA